MTLLYLEVSVTKFTLTMIKYGWLLPFLYLCVHGKSIRMNEELRFGRDLEDLRQQVEPVLESPHAPPQPVGLLQPVVTGARQPFRHNGGLPEFEPIFMGSGKGSGWLRREYKKEKLFNTKSFRQQVEPVLETPHAPPQPVGLLQPVVTGARQPFRHNGGVPEFEPIFMGNGKGNGWLKREYKKGKFSKANSFWGDHNIAVRPKYVPHTFPVLPPYPSLKRRTIKRAERS